jgi:hypothetical protein
MDSEFKPLHRDLLDIGIELNTISNDEHIPAIHYIEKAHSITYAFIHVLL